MWLGNVYQEFVYITVFLFTVLLIYFKWSFAYWKRKGVPYIEPSFPMGNFTGIITGSKSLGELWEDQYKTLKKRNLKHGGTFMLTFPHYMPTDLNIIKSILCTDFSHFMNHAVTGNEKVDPLNDNLLFLRDEKWRQLRIKLTPTFTSGKMKMMFKTLVNSTKELGIIFENAAVIGDDIDVKTTFQRFTIDVIGSVAFGIECNCLKNPNAEFLQMAKKTITVNFIDAIKFMLTFALPKKLLEFFKIKLARKEIEDFYFNLVEEIVKYREENDVYREDFMHLLLQLKNRGQIFDDKLLKDSNTNSEGLSLSQLTAQAVFFIVAGFETSATTMTFACFELAQNEDIQKIAREEINTVLKKHKGELTYDALSEMKYLDQIVSETLRKHPPIPVIDRTCNKEYKIPGTDIILEEGTKVDISTRGLHHDPDYYPEPEKFDPTRFTEENKAERPAITFVPFGEGPRACLGLRFGLMQTKVGLLTLLKDYKFKLSSKTNLPLKLGKSFVLSAENDIIIKLEKLA